MSLGSKRQGSCQPQGRWITVSKRAAIYERDSWACAYCGRGPRDARSLKQAAVVLTLDHLISKSEGGSNMADNLVTACRTCNSSRGAKLWTEYATGGAQERIEFLIAQPLDTELGKAIVASLQLDEAE